MNEKESLYFDMSLIFGFINGSVSTAVQRLMKNDFKTAGLEITPEQWTVMTQLWQKDGRSQREMCKATNKDKPSMTRIIDQLETLGLVERADSKIDKRIKVVYLTREGRSLEGKGRIAEYKILRKVLRGLSQNDIMTTQEVLKKVFNNTK